METFAVRTNDAKPLQFADYLVFLNCAKYTIMNNDAYNLFISFILYVCNKIIKALKALKALSLLWRYLPGIHPPVCHQELIHPSPPARQQRAAVSCSDQAVLLQCSPEMALVSQLLVGDRKENYEL